jgi:hypothetical protein
MAFNHVQLMIHLGQLILELPLLMGQARHNLIMCDCTLWLAMDELLKKDVGQDSRFYAMGVSCGQAP